jgi:hypothetical protein
VGALDALRPKDAGAKKMHDFIKKVLKTLAGSENSCTFALAIEKQRLQAKK